MRPDGEQPPVGSPARTWHRCNERCSAAIVVHLCVPHGPHRPQIHESSAEPSRGVCARLHRDENVIRQTLRSVQGAQNRRPAVLFYCQHSLGIGHLKRSFALCEALAARYHVVLLCGENNITYATGHAAPSQEPARAAATRSVAIITRAAARLVREPLIDFEEGADRLASAIADHPGVLAIDEYPSLAVRTALATLSSGVRAVIVLRDVEGVALSDVTTILGIDESQARQLLHCGRTAVREALERVFAPA